MNFGENGESLGNYFSRQEAMAALGEYYLKRYPYDATMLELFASVDRTA